MDPFDCSCERSIYGSVLYLWLCFAAVQCQIRLHLLHAWSLMKSQQVLSSRQNIRAGIWYRVNVETAASVHEADVCVVDGHPVVYLFLRWRSRRNRYFSCKDKEQLYCSVTNL